MISSHRPDTLRNIVDKAARLAAWAGCCTVYFQCNPDDPKGAIHPAMPDGVEPTDAELAPVVAVIEKMLADVKARVLAGRAAAPPQSSDDEGD
jgi:hypothetical protein